MQTSWSGVTTDQWYFVEVSWSVDDGLEIYADLQKVAADGRSEERNVDETLATESRLCVACLNAPKNASVGFRRIAANAIVDELKICYGSCAKLTELEFLQRGTPLLRYTSPLDVSARRLALFQLCGLLESHRRRSVDLMTEKKLPFPNFESRFRCKMQKVK